MASEILQTLYWNVAVKMELIWMAKLSIYSSMYVLALTYGLAFLGVTERLRLPIQPAEMGFFGRVAGVSLRDRTGSSEIWWEPGVEPLLL